MKISKCDTCGSMQSNGACVVCCPDWLYIGVSAVIRKGAKMQGCSFNSAGVEVIVKEATKRVRSESYKGFQCDTQSIWMIVEHGGKTGGIWFEDLNFDLHVESIHPESKP